VFLSALRTPDPKNKQALMQQDARLGEPVVVHTGPDKKPAEPNKAGSKAKGVIANVAPASGPELASRSDDDSTVPLPRPRPRIVRTAVSPAAQAAATQATAAPRPAAPKSTAKPATKSATKTDDKKK
jgi:hypothetical protein